MINKNIPIYLCSFTEKWENKIKIEGSFVNHGYGKINNRLIIWPKTVKAAAINPKNFIELKEHFKFDKLLIIDRIKGTAETVSIINHVNRSGQNFLRAVTPEGEFPQFPDMSKVYHQITGLRSAVVHTIGNERFKNPPTEKNIIWSELVGLIAPVAHYIGINVSAIGSENIDDVIKII